MRNWLSSQINIYSIIIKGRRINLKIFKIIRYNKYLFKEYARKDGEAIWGITIKIYEYNRNYEIRI